ncbi:sulfurtransferase [Longispora fulva]|uniref:Rhodanese-related sulfurtransferase n=1 Tax=Longispora fulva TaxID=619741 RepID=A0A8J7GMK3_9ACTN|nr:rhodanese-like domain-containing protein [Longispora fulva]MBG6139762.1 rhodanese-related sulfurtransferase [Longispora fulva]GIG57854.1 sulfurtransferase [Longispora fulva]
MFGEPLPSVSPSDVPAGAFLLDVREVDEWEAGHAPDAVHVPMSEIPARIAEVPEEGDVVVICRAGGRSARVVAYLQGNGRGNVFNLDGGMQAWDATGKPVVSAAGPGVVI